MYNSEQDVKQWFDRCNTILRTEFSLPKDIDIIKLAEYYQMQKDLLDYPDAPEAIFGRTLDTRLYNYFDLKDVHGQKLSDKYPVANLEKIGLNACSNCNNAAKLNAQLTQQYKDTITEQAQLYQQNILLVDLCQQLDNKIKQEAANPTDKQNLESQLNAAQDSLKVAKTINFIMFGFILIFLFIFLGLGIKYYSYKQSKTRKT